MENPIKTHILSTAKEFDDQFYDKKQEDGYSVILSGRKGKENWLHPDTPADVSDIKYFVSSAQRSLIETIVGEVERMDTGTAETQDSADDFKKRVLALLLDSLK